jgi:class 3 adenylate cyclase
VPHDRRVDEPTAVGTEITQAREERRLVTVLFADVVGSTSLGEALDPEDVRALLARMFAIARDAVERHGGLIEKYIGDAVMAVFGLPVAHDDDAARALAAAIDLRDRVRDDAVLAEHLQLRLGVNTGEVLASVDEHAPGPRVIGDAVNTAARLEQGAEPLQILVGERTVRSTGSRFAFGPPVELQAKGKSRPVLARQLEGIRSAGQRVAMRHRMVGRDADLAQLELVAGRVRDEGRPYLVSVVAPAGVGKSRLIEEFLGRLDRPALDGGPAPRVALAQCLPYGQRLTFWPLRAIALAILGIPDDTPPDRLRDAFADWLEAAGEPDAAATADVLAATLGAGDSDIGDRIVLHAAWRRFVELAAARQPVVLVIEDLHWSSDSLLDLVEAMLAPQDEVPLLMVALARPELLDRRPSWGGGRRNAVSIALDPLPQRAVGDLVRDLLEVPDEALVAAVVGRAEGNPFYAGEIVRTVIERLGPDPSAEAVPAAIAALPDTVQATVLARLDALDPVARRTVQLAAVIGRSFPLAAVASLEPAVDTASLRLAVGSLLDRDFVRPDGPDRYAFRHILIREVAYGMLPRTERARLHAAAGAWLEGSARSSGREEELAELVAFHYREATALRAASGEPVDADLAASAIDWLELAASTAMAGAASSEAARHLEAAAALAPPARRALIEERIGEAWVGGDQALDAFEEAHRLSVETGAGPDQVLRTLSQVGIVLGRWTGSLSVRPTDDEFGELSGRIVGLRSGSSEPRAIALSLLAESFLSSAMLRRSGDGRAGWEATAVPRAAEAATEALEFAERHGLGDLMSSTLDAAAAAALQVDRYDLARAYSERRLGLAGLSTVERLDAQVMVAWSLVDVGAFAEAERAAARVFAGLGPGQGASWRLGAGGWRIDALHRLGRWDEALAEAGRAMDAWRESEVPTPGFATHGFVSAWLIAHARRDAVDAERWATAVRSIVRRVPEDDRQHALGPIVDEDPAGVRVQVLDRPTRFAGRLDFVELALMFLADSRATGPSGPVRSLVRVGDERRLGGLAAQAERVVGIADGETASLERALAWFEAAGARPFVARCRTELGILRGDASLVDDGLAILEALGDQRQMERVARERAAGRFEDPAAS